MILAIVGIAAVVFLAIAIILHGYSMGKYAMRGSAPAPYTYHHSGWGYHH